VDPLRRKAQPPSAGRLHSRPNDRHFHGARIKRANLAAVVLITIAIIGARVRADVQPRTDPASPPTALDRYVAAADPSYGYKVNSTFSADGLTATVLRMTLQTWLTEMKVDQERLGTLAQTHGSHTRCAPG
jgi:hypothetical protein